VLREFMRCLSMITAVIIGDFCNDLDIIKTRLIAEYIFISSFDPITRFYSN